MEATITAIVCCFIAFVVIFLIFGLCVMHLTSSPHPDLGRHDSEKYYTDPSKDGEMSEFPSLHDPASVDLSVVVPSYNEEQRLPVMLDEALEHLENKQKTNRSFNYEIIVVDDGSADQTSQVALEYTEKYGSDKVRVLALEKNRGKGGAIRLGVFVCRGKQILFADADGASKFSDLQKLEDDMKKIDTHSHNMAVVCGSRAHLEQESIAQRTYFRSFLMYGFHFLVSFLCVRGIKDTQCGFKLFTRPAARVLFSNLHVERWAFDVDLLYLAQHFNIPVSEVCIVWNEIEGSKMVPFWSWLQMGKDILLIRLRYLTGAWKIRDLDKIK